MKRQTLSLLFTLVLGACGGSTPISTGAGGSKGAAGTTAATGAGGTGTGSGAAGRTGGNNMMGEDGGSQDAARIPCGTTARGCNPSGGSPLCDTANNRCVECLSDMHCSSDPTSSHCDVMNGSCEECLTDMHCSAGHACLNLSCVATCTSDPDCATDGGSTRIHCGTGTPKVCVACVTDAHCAGNASQPFCSTTRNRCIQCRTDADCAAGSTCSTTSSCRAPSDGGGGQQDATAGEDARPAG